MNVRKGVVTELCDLVLNMLEFHMELEKVCINRYSTIRVYTNHLMYYLGNSKHPPRVKKIADSSFRGIVDALGCRQGCTRDH
jgi:hypothetical protein